MRKLFKYIANSTVRPLVKNYLSKTRVYHHNGLSLTIPPQVFHPAFFFSTKFLLNYLLELSMENKKLLELGAGSGLIAFSSAKKGAIVTATDINKTAVEYLHKNKAANNVNISIIESNLFDQIPQQQFDIIAINPPYYKQAPVTDKDYAWFCGENGEYFEKLFSTMSAYMHPNTKVYMIISDDSDLDMTSTMAAAHNFKMIELTSKRIGWEKNYIFSIEH